MVKMHQTQFKFYTSDDDNWRRPFNYWMVIAMSISSFNDGVNLAKDADHLSSWAPLWRVHCYKQCLCKDIRLCMAMCLQQLQSELDIHEYLTAQKYIDEIVRPHVKPHVDNHAVEDSTVFMRGGAKPRTARIRQGVLARATNLLLSTKNADICIIVFMRGGAKPRTARIRQGVLARATNLLLSTKNADICIIAN